MMGLDNRVKILRAELGLSQYELAKRTGVSQSAINKVEQADTLKPRFLLELAEALGTTPEFLRDGTTILFRKIKISDKLTVEVEPVENMVKQGRSVIDLVVTARVENNKDALFTVSQIGPLTVLYPTNSALERSVPVPFNVQGEWYNGTVAIGGLKHNLRITGVVRALIIPCN